jgi:hypothetical protein
MFDIRKRRGVLALTFAIVLPGMTACSDDPVDVHDEEPEFLELTIGAQTIRVAANGVITGGPVNVPVGTSVAVTAQFLDHDGEVIEFEPGEYELRAVTLNPTIVTFGKTGTFSGSITGVAVGAGTITFQLYHLAEAHEDFEQDVPITVVAAT